MKLLPAERSDLLAAARFAAAEQHRDEVTTDLPAEPEVFVGRVAELATIEQFISDASADDLPRSILISGAAGLGKTALATMAAHRIRGASDLRCIFVDLRGFDAAPVQPADALSRALSALGLDARELPTGVDELRARYLSELVAQQCLVVLDNAAGDDQISALLPDGGRASVIVTTRRKLTATPFERRVTLDPMTSEDAVDLLLATLGEAPSAHDRGALKTVAELCDRNPLALRIAGARLRSRPEWSAAYLATRLRDTGQRLDTLTLGSIRVESALAISYEQLTDVAAAVFRGMSLIPGPTAAAELIAVASGIDRRVAEEALDELVELGLVSHSFASRYALHDLTRLFAEHRLASTISLSERNARRDDVVHWLLAMSAGSGRFFGPGSEARETISDDIDSAMAAKRWLEIELDSWFPAFQTAAALGWWREVVDLAEAMHWYSDYALRWPGWVDVFRLGAQAASALADARAEATQLGYLSWALSTCIKDREGGLVAANQSFALARSLGDAQLQGWARVYAAGAYRGSGKLDDALAMSEDAVQHFELAGDREGLPQALMTCGILLHDLDRFEDSNTMFERVIDFLRSTEGDSNVESAAMSMSTCMTGIGLNLGKMSRHDEAIRWLADAVVAADRAGNDWLRGWARIDLARAYVASGARVPVNGLVLEAKVVYERANLEVPPEWIKSFPVLEASDQQA